MGVESKIIVHKEDPDLLLLPEAHDYVSPEWENLFDIAISRENIATRGEKFAHNHQMTAGNDDLDRNGQMGDRDVHIEVVKPTVSERKVSSMGVSMGVTRRDTRIPR